MANEIVKWWNNLFNKNKDKEQKEKYSDAEKALNDKLAQMDKEYIANLPKDEFNPSEYLDEKLDIPRKEYNGLSEEEIAIKAKEDNDKLLESKKLNTEVDYDKNVKKYESQKEENKKKAEDDLLKLAQEYVQNKKANDNKMVKNNLTMSSIKTNVENALKNDYEGESQYTKEKLENKINLLDSEIESVNQRKEKAMEALDLEYAVKLDESVKKLLKEKQSAIDEIEAYNAKAAKDELTYQKNKANYLQEYRDKLAKEKNEKLNNEIRYGMSGDKKIEYDNRLSTVIEFYDSMPRRIAEQMVNGNIMLKNYLGTYYNTVLDRYKEVD